MESENSIKKEFNNLFDMETKGITKYPMSAPVKPQIYDRAAGLHYCFSINEIYIRLFIGNKSKSIPSLINFPASPHEQRYRSELGKFLLPSDLYKKIATIQDAKDNSKPYVRDKDWQEFLTIGSKNTKIHNVLFDLFSSDKADSEKAFVEEVQRHFVWLLKAADFSPKLKETLIYWGNNAIVPEKKSKEANSAFLAMVDENHEGISKAIANFFVSAMLGLYPVKYDSNGDSRKKTYLLNSLGMKLIWTPELLSGTFIKLHSALQPYEESKYDKAYEKGMEWLGTNYDPDSKDLRPELAEVYLLLGKCLCFYPQFCRPENLSGDLRLDITDWLDIKHCSEENASDKTNKSIKTKYNDGILFLKKSIKLDSSNPEVFYILYELLKDKANKDAKGYLKTAFAQNYAKAVIEVAFLYLNNACISIFNDVTEGLLLKKINYIIDNEQKNTVVDVSECLYLRGLFSKNHDNDSKANEDFESAAKRGNEKARQEISRKKRLERHSFPTFIDDPKAPCCYANTFTGNNYAVASTFPSETWVMYTPDKTDKKSILGVSDIETFFELQGESIFDHSQLVFLLMSEDEEKNLNECLILLDKLFNIVLDKSEKRRWQIIDAIDIYVSAQYETASMLIDANISDMGNDIYFKVHITDEDRDTVHKLLCEAPLFLPALNGIKKEKFTKIVLFGDSETNYNFIRESIACAYLKEHQIDITLIGENADMLESRLHQACPGIYNNPHISCIRPKFIKCRIGDADFPNYIYSSVYDPVLNDENQYEGSFDADMVKALFEANYFVVDYADDLENIRFATELRTWLLRSRGTFDRAPFIAVKCSDAQNSYLASHLTLVGQASGNSYFNKYDLFPFGISAQTYSYENIIKNPVLNDFALRIHKSYYGDDERAAENDYYSYSYNADSSLSTAIGLCYRFFAAGVAFKDKDHYLNFGFFNMPNIGLKFEEMYKGKLDDLTSLEQSRWNGFMLSRGWEPANLSQVQAYKEQSTGFAHKHTLAKMHPFIREWEDLNNPDLERVLGILKSKFNYERKPQVTTRKSIADTAKFFKAVEKENEKTR